MFSSVRRRLLLNSLLISLATILSVGVVTLLLVDAYFGRQERDYLRFQASLYAPTMTQTMAANTTPELKRMVAMVSYVNQVRVQILNADEEIIADSGDQTDRSLFNPLSTESSEYLIGVIVDDTGQVVSISPPINRQNNVLGQVGLSFAEPWQLFDNEASFTGISDVRYRTPLLTGGQTVGYLELSNGPSVGQQVISSIRLALLFGSLVALAIAVAVGLISARQVTHPLSALGQAVEAMGVDDLSVRAPGSRLSEYDRLAAQFNSMAQRLEASIERLEEEREILRRMTADASHELRTPLTALKTFNALLQEELPNESVASRFVLESEKQINQLDMLTTGILDLSRLEARISGTDFITADLRDVISESVQTVMPLIEEKQHTLDVGLPEEPVFYTHDPAAMKQAIKNLLHNAIKFTPAGGNIGASLTVYDENIRIVVSDDGIGIPTEIQFRIFDRFYRVPGQRNGGKGLGLAICREIVIIHNGRILVNSEINRGTIFTLQFPVLQA